MLRMIVTEARSRGYGGFSLEPVARTFGGARADESRDLRRAAVCRYSATPFTRFFSRENLILPHTPASFRPQLKGGHHRGVRLIAAATLFRMGQIPSGALGAWKLPAAFEPVSRAILALFDLARDQRQIEAVGSSLDTLSQALLDSKEFAELAASPLVSRNDAGQAFGALGATLGLDPLTANFLGVLARNGRKDQLAAVIRAFKRLAAEHRGETSADVITAHPLGDDQLAALRQKLRTRAGREVSIDATVDPQILGGIVVKLGSQMIDASIRTKLNRLLCDERLRTDMDIPPAEISRVIPTNREFLGDAEVSEVGTGCRFATALRASSASTNVRGRDGRVRQWQPGKGLNLERITSAS